MNKVCSLAVCMGATRATRDLLRDQHHCHHEKPPKNGIAASANGGPWSTRLFLAQFKARRSGPVEPTSVKEEGQTCPPARPGTLSKAWKTVCGHRHLSVKHFLLPFTSGRSQAGSRHCLGFRTSTYPILSDPRTPSPRPDRGRRSGIPRDVSHTGPLIFRNYLPKCTMLPDDLISSE